ncbi:MAG: hypothetical protein ACREQX_16530 [Candidatus Binataceae bacterium]
MFNDTRTNTPGNLTFYGALDTYSAADNRQPFPGIFSARFINDRQNHCRGCKPFFPNGASLIVWRDPKVAQSAFTCGTLPIWYPLGQEMIVAFDEQEHLQELTGISPFPLATQRVTVGSGALPVSFSSGWLFLDLNDTEAVAPNVPPNDPAQAQAFVDVIEQGSPYSIQHRAQQLDAGTFPYVLPE